jgi:hypothetical protein
MRLPPLAAAALAAATIAAAPAAADETTFCNQFITSLPYTITVQGHYCFNRNLSTAISSGAAITINADYVFLDLNNFKLGGGGAGPATNAIGIRSVNRSNITVRGGNIRGFAFGIALEGTNTYSATNLLVEKNVVDGNRKVGIIASGRGAVVRDNIVSFTGPGSGFHGGVTAGISQIPSHSTGAVLGQNSSLDVIGNVINIVDAHAGDAVGIHLPGLTRNTVSGNVIREVNSTLGASVGVLGSMASVCKDNVYQGSGTAYASCAQPPGANFP